MSFRHSQGTTGEIQSCEFCSRVSSYSRQEWVRVMALRVPLRGEREHGVTQLGGPSSSVRGHLAASQTGEQEEQSWESRF